MTAWRMAFRVGPGGTELWPDCRRRGVAAITYSPLYDVDLSKYQPNEPEALWARLSAPQKYSLRQVAYRMRKGDVIYAKQGSTIVGKGIVRGPYRFDWKNRLRVHGDIPWAHQVPVQWLSDFAPIEVSLGDQQLWTVRELTASQVRRVEREQQQACSNWTRAKKTTKQAEPTAVDFPSARETKRITSRVRRIIRDTKTARLVKAMRENKCQICGKALYLDDERSYAESHHIQPLGAPHNGPDVAENILCVCPITTHSWILELSVYRNVN